MTRHSWVILEKPKSKATVNPKDFRFRNIHQRVNDETIYQVECKECGTIVFTSADRILDWTVHKDWVMEEDCDLEKIRFVMEE